MRPWSIRGATRSRIFRTARKSSITSSRSRVPIRARRIFTGPDDFALVPVVAFAFIEDDGFDLRADALARHQEIVDLGPERGVFRFFRRPEFSSLGPGYLERRAACSHLYLG